MRPDLREATASDSRAIADLALAAFGSAEGPEIEALIVDLVADPTARPLLSLVATLENRIVGHVLFSAVRLAPPRGVSARLLAPLAVHPQLQSRGIGRALVEEGCRRLAEQGVDLVFVLGHPAYYPRCGFSPAGPQGFEAPFPIPEPHADAWMVRGLRVGIPAAAGGRVICARTLADPKYWLK
jgi:predicted N-acetyltransferase YhbS